MKLIDTHCHLYLEEFDADRDVLVKAARESGIERLLLPNVDQATVNNMFRLADQYPDFVFPMMGFHPTSIDRNYVDRLTQIEKLLYKRTYCAIGEIGIDLYWDKTFLEEQIIAFEEQLKWSVDMKLPVAIHTREAMPYVLESIYKVGADKLTGVFHSFTGSVDDLKEIEKLQGFKIGINGVVTFKNSKLQDVLSQSSLDMVVLETDAPYLPPVPYRGKRNEPYFIWKTAEKLADVYGTTLEDVVELTRRNALMLFGFSDKLIKL